MLLQHHVSLSQHAFLRASHSRNAAYIRIPGYRRFSTLVCRNTHFSVLRTPEMLHTFAFRAIDASPHWFVATRRVSCRNTHFSVLRTLEMLHTFAFRAIGASPHWFVATRISPCSALPKCCIHSHSGLSTLLHIGLSQHVVFLVATRISPCFALSKCCIHSHSGLSPYLLMYVCSVNRQSTLPASSHVPCDYRTIATSSSRGMCKLHPYAR